jgi:hypothetical protein
MDKIAKPVLVEILGIYIYIFAYGKSFVQDQSLHANISTCTRIGTDVLHVSSAHMNAIDWIIS